MAWIQKTKNKAGIVTYWIRDVRNDIQWSFDSRSASDAEAQMKLEQYRIRKDLEKEGYDDRYQELADRMPKI